jgi:hypothetical protein
MIVIAVTGVVLLACNQTTEILPFELDPIAFPCLEKPIGNTLFHIFVL